MISRPIHQLRPGEIFQALETSAGGIPSGEVAVRQALYGKNILSEEPVERAWQRFLGHTVHPFALLLWVSGGVAFLIREPVLGAVIWILVLANAAFSFWREHRAEEAMLALRHLLPALARVIREGKEESIPASEVVPGDVLVLAEGDYIPADGRVVEEYGLRVSNAILTGEAVAAHKTADASFREGISELERPNLVFAGTSVVSGTGRAVVYSTGMLTQFGRVARLTQTVAEEASPLQVELEGLTRRIALVALSIGGVVFLAGALDIGLPANVTLSLAMAGQRLAKRGVLVKKLSVIETLGSLSIICTDKSGTLTQNQMTVREIWVGGKRLSITGVGYDPKGKILADPTGKEGGADLRMLLIAASLCNNSRLSEPTRERPTWSFLGDQTEAAMRVAAIKGGVDEQAVQASFPRVHELPFEARRKRMSTIHRPLNHVGVAQQDKGDAFGMVTTNNRHEVAFVKGAPREVLDLCTHIRMDNQVEPLDACRRQLVLAATDDYAGQALRVLALAYRELPARPRTYSVENVERGLTFLGIMAMHDPARPEVAEAVRTCRQAGIRTVLITGDYGLTAEALARRVGLLETSSPRILTGAEVDELDDQAVQDLLDQEVVFARMAPEHKLRLVAAFQRRGEVVAVTGDGANDAPALRKADVGIAMGITGTNVAKEAADIILTNDNFASLVSAIEEGRAVYQNVRKFITYIFSSNVPEILPFLLTDLANIPLALTVKQILAIDLGTDILPGLALGAEKPEPDIMQRPPRRRSERLIDRSVLRRAFFWLGPIEAVLAYSGFFVVYAWNTGAGPRSWDLNAPLSGVNLLAVTVFHAGVVMAQVGNAFACRTATHRGRTLGWFSNRFLWIAIGMEVLIILALIYIPPLAQAFDHVALPPVFWAWLVLYAPLLYGLESIRKWFVRR
jgi:magnesium-transporting ATPase (P-type)